MTLMTIIILDQHSFPSIFLTNDNRFTIHSVILRNKDLDPDFEESWYNLEICALAPDIHTFIGFEEALELISILKGFILILSCCIAFFVDTVALIIDIA